MSGHNPHGRQGQANPAWNHLQVPNFFPRQPQLAHMSSDRPLAHSPLTWHTPTTSDPSIKAPPGPIFNLQQMMLAENRSVQPNIDNLNLNLSLNRQSSLETLNLNRQTSLDSLSNMVEPINYGRIMNNSGIGSVDLSVSRSTISPHSLSNSPNFSKNGQNGDSIMPMSLSVRDAKQINSLDSSEIHKLRVERSPSLDITKSTKCVKRNTKNMDSILERLNNSSVDVNLVRPDITFQRSESLNVPREVYIAEEPVSNPVQAISSPVITPNPIYSHQDDLSNEDSLDSTGKSRRKRKPNKTSRVQASELTPIQNVPDIVAPEIALTRLQAEAVPVPTTIAENISSTKRRSSSEEIPSVSQKVRRKTLSESETIDNIAAMIASTSESTDIVMTDPDADELKTKPDVENQTIDLTDVLMSPTHEKPEAIIKSPEKDESMEITETVDVDLEKSNAVVPVVEDVPIISNVQMITSNSKPVKKRQPSEIKSVEMHVEPQKPVEEKVESFVTVENQLEEMFAGIEEQPDESDEARKTEIFDLNKGENVSSTSPEKSKKPRRDIKKVIKKRAANNQKNLKKKLNNNKNIVKNLKLKPKIEQNTILTYDSGSNASSNKSRGPFVQIKGPRDSPISVNVINTPILDDEDKKPTKLKKTYNEEDFKQKSRTKGLHSSTLSMKYDSTNADASWICVFCKKGPHFDSFRSPGDLFGPYLINAKCENSEELDNLFKMKRTKSDMQIGGRNKRLKSNDNPVSDNEMYFGLLRVDDTSFEVWGHEDCLVWAPGVHLISNKLIGLENAIWQCAKSKCVVCELTGASISCLHHGCVKITHLNCAQKASWFINESEYKANCPEHS